MQFPGFRIYCADCWQAPASAEVFWGCQFLIGAQRVSVFFLTCKTYEHYESQYERSPPKAMNCIIWAYEHSWSIGYFFTLKIRGVFLWFIWILISRSMNLCFSPQHPAAPGTHAKLWANKVRQRCVNRKAKEYLFDDEPRWLLTRADRSYYSEHRDRQVLCLVIVAFRVIAVLVTDAHNNFGLYRLWIQNFVNSITTPP